MYVKEDYLVPLYISHYTYIYSYIRDNMDFCILDYMISNNCLYIYIYIWLDDHLIHKLKIFECLIYFYLILGEINI